MGFGFRVDTAGEKVSFCRAGGSCRNSDKGSWNGHLQMPRKELAACQRQPAGKTHGKIQFLAG